ncbi:MAG: IPT/TIG domain-containing protein [Candidatus Omnitrophica bacterium]|nr:IPT/TIG domain-containing protein [Candidatus Omnitrophota bacterium]
MVYTIEFADLNGWTKPANIPIEIQFNQSALSLTGTYTQLTGSVSVYLSPPGAVSAGAKWSLDNEPWQSSGASVVGIPIGPHSLRFSNAPGWLTPEERLVTVSTNQTSLVYQNYEEESPDPTIKSITPPSGPIVGGSQLTILGRNLDPPISAVTFGVHRPNR